MKITSSGVIRNESLPRVGIIGANNVSDDLLTCIIVQGVDAGLVEYVRELEKQEKTELEIEHLLNFYESTGPYLYGFIEKNGMFEVDKTAEFSLVFSSESNNIAVEWSKTTRQCTVTSPCYVMANGDGPCGDLDSDGNDVLAYSLPNDCLKGGKV